PLRASSCRVLQPAAPDLRPALSFPTRRSADLGTTVMSLLDPFQRSITYLRLSVTDRCDFRCVYCMTEDMTFLPRAQVLSLEELEIGRASCREGVSRSGGGVGGKRRRT